MRDYVQGIDYLLEAFKVDDYYPFACGTGLRLRRINEYDSTVTPDSGEIRTRKPTGLSDIEIEFAGVTVLQDPVDTIWKGWEFLTRQMRDNGVFLRVTLKDIKNNIKQFGGFFYPQEIELNGVVGDVGEDSIKFISGGTFSTDGGIDPPVNSEFVKRIEWITTGAEPNILQDDFLKGKTKEQILEVSREGDDKYTVIDAGVPNERQVLLENVGGTLQWSIDFEVGEAVFALVSII